MIFTTPKLFKIREIVFQMFNDRIKIIDKQKKIGIDNITTFT